MKLVKVEENETELWTIFIYSNICDMENREMDITMITIQRNHIIGIQ